MLSKGGDLFRSAPFTDSQFCTLYEKHSSYRSFKIIDTDSLSSNVLFESWSSDDDF
jgi:hypothetical protein